MGIGRNILPEDDARRGWFKLVIPAMSDVFGHLWGTAQASIWPFIFCKMDPEQTAFDIELSVPLYALRDVVLVQASHPTSKGSGKIPKMSIMLIALSKVASEHEDRCYMPSALVSLIIPIKPDHEIVSTLIQATTESGLVLPTDEEVQQVGSKILSLKGEPVGS